MHRGSCPQKYGIVKSYGNPFTNVHSESFKLTHSSKDSCEYFLSKSMAGANLRSGFLGFGVTLL